MAGAAVKRMIVRGEYTIPELASKAMKIVRAAKAGDKVADTVAPLAMVEAENAVVDVDIGVSGKLVEDLNVKEGDEVNAGDKIIYAVEVEVPVS